jgi:hypothetical protein
MTEVIAERAYEFAPAAGPEESLVVQLGKPTWTTDLPNPAWYCTWSVIRAGTTKTMSALGEDSIQALIIALSALRTDLQLIAKRGKLTSSGVEGPSLDI